MLRTQKMAVGLARRLFSEFHLKGALGLLWQIWLVIDVPYYRRTGGFLKFLFPRSHFWLRGMWKKLSPSPFFNSEQYSESLQSESVGRRLPLVHYLMVSSGTTPTTNWDEIYLKQRPDVRNYRYSPLTHFSRHGKRENISTEIPGVHTNVEAFYELTCLLPHSAKDFVTNPGSTNILFRSCQPVFLTDTDSQENQVKWFIKVQTELKDIDTCQFDDRTNWSVTISANSTIEINGHGRLALDIRWLRYVVSRVHDQRGMNDLDSGDYVVAVQTLITRVYASTPDHWKLLDRHFVAEFLTQELPAPHLFAAQVPIFTVRTEYANPVQREFPRRVLLVSHEDSFTGAPIYLVDIANELRALKMEVLILSFREGSKAGLFDMNHLDNVYLEDLAMDGRVSATKALWMLSEEGKRSIARLLHDFDPDVVLVNSINASDAINVAFDNRVRTILYVHESFGFSGENSKPNGAYENLFARSLEKSSLVLFGSRAAQRAFHTPELRFSSEVLPSIRHVARIELEAQMAKRAAVRRNLSIGQGEFVFLSISTFERRKRIEDIIDAFHGMDGVHIRLVLVGALPLGDIYSDGIRAMATRDTRIVIVNVQNNVEDYYFASDVFVFASEREVFPLVLQEASAHGIPRIVSCYPGIHESVPKSSLALLYEVGDIQELRAHMVQLLNSDVERERLCQDALLHQMRIGCAVTDTLLDHITDDDSPHFQLLRSES
jgi:glycosyltransferase involved in cell wall biosynthesis